MSGLATEEQCRLSRCLASSWFDWPTLYTHFLPPSPTDTVLASGSLVCLLASGGGWLASCRDVMPDASSFLRQEPPPGVPGTGGCAVIDGWCIMRRQGVGNQANSHEVWGRLGVVKWGCVVEWGTDSLHEQHPACPQGQRTSLSQLHCSVWLPHRPHAPPSPPQEQQLMAVHTVAHIISLVAPQIVPYAPSAAGILAAANSLGGKHDYDNSAAGYVRYGASRASLSTLQVTEALLRLVNGSTDAKQVCKGTHGNQRHNAGVPSSSHASLNLRWEPRAASPDPFKANASHLRAVPLTRRL